MTRSKVSYPTREAAEAAAARRHADPTFPGRVRAYRSGTRWHLTSKAFRRSMPNFRGGGWARDWLIETIELGVRASRHLAEENRSNGGD